MGIMVNYYLYNVPFKIRNLSNNKESVWIYGHTIASSVKDARRRIKTAYNVSRFGRVTIRSKMKFDKPKTKGIA